MWEWRERLTSKYAIICLSRSFGSQKKGWRTFLVSWQSNDSHHSLSALIFLRERGGESCPLRSGREWGSLFSFWHSIISTLLRESQTITFLLLQRVFNSGRSRNSKVLNLGRVILVVTIPSFSSPSNSSNTSAIISSNCPQLRTSISSRLCKCSSNPAKSSFFFLEQFPITNILRQEKMSGGNCADATSSFLNSTCKLFKLESAKASRVWREMVQEEDVEEEEENESTCSIPSQLSRTIPYNSLAWFKDGTSDKLLIS